MSSFRLSMSVIMRLVLAGLFVLTCGIEPSSFAQSDRPARSEAVEAQISTWIAALGAREFDTRDRAMHSLIAAGEVAIEPVRSIIARRDHEVATRAVLVLKGIGEKGDIVTLELALAALTRVAESSPTSPVLKRATDAKERLELVRQDRTVDFFRERGAEVTPELLDVWTAANLAQPVFSMEIGAGWKGTEKDLERLKWLRDVEQVCLVGPKVADSWIPYLRSMPHLSSVKIKHAEISTKGIQELSQLERLRALRLMYVPLGDEMVPHLEKCESLIRLVVISRKLTEEGEKRLKLRFDDGVECPRGAMLGVRAGMEEPWAIREVVPGSAADKAGLRVDDRVVKFNDQPVVTFQELRTLISKCAPGDSASLEVQRVDELVSMKIIFGEWD